MLKSKLQRAFHPIKLCTEGRSVCVIVMDSKVMDYIMVWISPSFFFLIILMRKSTTRDFKLRAPVNSMFWSFIIHLFPTQKLNFRLVALFKYLGLHLYI